MSRLLETWELTSDLGGDGHRTIYRIPVMAVKHVGGRSGQPTTGFKATLDFEEFGVAPIHIHNTDIGKLYEQAKEMLEDLLGKKTEHFEKVLVIYRDQDLSPLDHTRKARFALCWEIGFRSPDKEYVLNERRGFEVRTYDIHLESHDGSLRNITHRKESICAIIPWTQAREDVLIKAGQQLKDLQAHINNLIMGGQAEDLLDGKLQTNLLLAPKPHSEKDE